MKLTLYTYFGIFFICTSVLGVHFDANRLMKTISPESIPTDKKMECPNLSGVWTGVCIDLKSEKSTYALDIKQRGCTDVSIRAKDFDLFFEVGGSFRGGLSSTKKGFDGDMTTTASWKGNNALDSQIAYSGKARVGNVNWYGHTSVSFTQKDGKLNTHQETTHYTVLEGTTIPTNFKFVCEFTKNQ